MSSPIISKSPSMNANACSTPKRSVTVSCPIHGEDGRLKVYQGYRVQHHLTLGLPKGGTRYSANLELGEVAALAIWMS
jgi:glutamate dehydrogenase (NAD(P)+)